MFHSAGHSDIRQSRHSLWLDLEKECVLVSDGCAVAFACIATMGFYLSDGREMASSIC